MGTDRTRYTHPNPGELGKPYVGSVSQALAGQSHVEDYRGTLGESVRAIVPVRDADRQDHGAGRRGRDAAEPQHHPGRDGPGDHRRGRPRAGARRALRLRAEPLPAPRHPGLRARGTAPALRLLLLRPALGARGPGAGRRQGTAGALQRPGRQAAGVAAGRHPAPAAGRQGRAAGNRGRALCLRPPGDRRDPPDQRPGACHLAATGGAAGCRRVRARSLAAAPQDRRVVAGNRRHAAGPHRGPGADRRARVDDDARRGAAGPDPRTRQPPAHHRHAHRARPGTRGPGFRRGGPPGVPAPDRRVRAGHRRAVPDLAAGGQGRPGARTRHHADPERLRVAAGRGAGCQGPGDHRRQPARQRLRRGGRLRAPAGVGGFRGGRGVRGDLDRRFRAGAGHRPDRGILPDGRFLQARGPRQRIARARAGAGPPGRGQARRHPGRGQRRRRHLHRHHPPAVPGRPWAIGTRMVRRAPTPLGPANAPEPE